METSKSRTLVTFSSTASIKSVSGGSNSTSSLPSATSSVSTNPSSVTVSEAGSMTSSSRSPSTSISESTSTSTLATFSSVSKPTSTNTASSPISTPAMSAQPTKVSTTPTASHLPIHIVSESSTGDLGRGTSSSPITPLTRTSHQMSAVQSPTTASTSNSPPNKATIGSSSQNPSSQSVNIQRSTTVVTPTATSTITDFPVSTFSTPVAVTMTQGGNTVVSTPSFVTLLTTTTNTDGSAVTWTHVVANPNKLSATSSRSFLQNTGAVAGVFVVVGIVAASFLLCLLYFIRRSRRTKRQSKWLATLQNPRYEEVHHEDKNPFDDLDIPSSSPPVRPLTSDSNATLHRNIYPAHNAVRNYQTKELDATDAGVTRGSAPPGWAAGKRGLFNDGRNYQPHPMEFAFLNPELEAKVQDSGKPALTADSSPSIYAATLPRAEDEPEETLEGNERNGQNERDRRTSQSTYVTEAPPRPPKSHLRSLTSRGELAYYTPDSSTGPASPSGSTSDHSPTKGTHSIYARRTLLDVRPRSAESSSNRHSLSSQVRPHSAEATSNRHSHLI
ncbi:hypothetical protein AX17_000363 [Amanita inopinata Kibby_2008]|nr:hypothetical protein AX17_000363 [Amanita inopinata Kibby_2008]